MIAPAVMKTARAKRPAMQRLSIHVTAAGLGVYHRGCPRIGPTFGPMSGFDGSPTFAPRSRRGLADTDHVQVGGGILPASHVRTDCVRRACRPGVKGAGSCGILERDDAVTGGGDASDVGQVSDATHTGFAPGGG